MNTKILIGLAVVLGLLLLAFTGPKVQTPAPEPVPVSEVRGELVGGGRFLLEQAGTRVLDEDYTILYHPEEGYVLISEGEIIAGGETIPLTQQTSYDGDFHPTGYRATIEAPSGRQTVTAALEDGNFVMEVEAGIFQQVQGIGNPACLVLLDNNLIGHYVMLWMAITDGAVSEEFTAAIPQALLSLPGRVAGPEPVEFGSSGAVHQGISYRVGLGDTQIDLIEFEGRMVGMVNRMQGAIAYDVGRFPAGIEILEDEAPATPAGVREEEVSFESGDITIAGTLAIPAGEEPLPAALFLHGSGPVDRDGNAANLPMDAYRQLAHGLAEAGIASLRFDKRGVGASGGDAAIASRTDLVDDASAALGFLKDRPEIDASRILVVGHSEGAYLGPILAAADPGLAGLALLAGAARPLGVITRWQVETMLRLSGADEEQVAASLEQQDEYIAFVEGSTGEWDDYSVADLQGELAWLTEAATQQLLSTPLGLTWLREHYLADTAGVLSQIAVPVFILNGEKDLQVPAAEGEAIRQILADAGNDDVTIHALTDLNHLLRNHPEPPSLLFRHIEEPVDPRVIDLLRQWAVERVGG